VMCSQIVSGVAISAPRHTAMMPSRVKASKSAEVRRPSV
jgi:hypothetical protein